MNGRGWGGVLPRRRPEEGIRRFSNQNGRRRDSSEGGGTSYPGRVGLGGLRGGASLSPQAHGRADHRAGLEVGCGPRGLRRGGVLPRNSYPETEVGNGYPGGGKAGRGGEKGGLGLTGGEKGG